MMLALFVSALRKQMRAIIIASANEIFVRLKKLIESRPAEVVQSGSSKHYNVSFTITEDVIVLK